MNRSALRELISEEQIRDRIREMGRDITRDHADMHELVIVCVLKGAFIFTADLVREIRIPCHIEFIRASSYGTRRSSSGLIMVNHDIDIEGRNVLLVEDIIDTGQTLARIREELIKLEPASFRICTLLDKPSARKVPASVDYTGFTIQDTFVAGYGLDAAGMYRELPFIGVPTA
jgi:hypoxanthine phosphoribosyltransferase